VEGDPMRTLQRHAHRRVGLHAELGQALEQRVLQGRGNTLGELAGDRLVDLGRARLGVGSWERRGSLMIARQRLKARPQTAIGRRSRSQPGGGRRAVVGARSRTARRP